MLSLSSLCAAAGRLASKAPPSRLASHLRAYSSGVHSGNDLADEDGLVQMDDPYKPQPRRCLFCEHNIKPDYKNPRLLSQFTSSFTGRTYDRHVTGLCREQQRRLIRAIYLSRRAGYMPIMAKNPRYFNDPKLFDPMRPQRPNPH